MIELNKRQYEILTFMANTGVDIHYIYDLDILALIQSGLCNESIRYRVQIAPHAQEMFRDAGLRRVN